MRYLYQLFERFLVKYILWLIRFYQKTFSPDHGLLAYRFPYGWCRFRPTCSEYSAQAFMKYGLWRGGWLSFRRIIRCHPFSKGGEDPLI